MNECPKCGREFEGKFCPYCGEQWQEDKTCPKCGVILNGSARFCNKCGYAFYQEKQTSQKKLSLGMKFTVLRAWLKSHMKIVAPVASLLVLVIILSCVIPVVIANQTNGIYYKMRGSELDKKTYFVLDGGTWKDEDGETGSYEKDGDKITFYTELFGTKEELCDGTLVDYVLKVKNGTFVSEKHKHRFGDWETIREVTYDMEGLKARSCICQLTETQIISNEPTLGLQYSLTYNKESYSVTGIGTTTNVEILIPRQYKNLPVTEIGKSAFKSNKELISIKVPDSVKLVKGYAFKDCTSLTNVAFFSESTTFDGEAFSGCLNLTHVTLPKNVGFRERVFYGCRKLISITYNGTIDDWHSIKKNSNWNEDTGDYTIHCIDGDISKGATKNK